MLSAANTRLLWHRNRLAAGANCHCVAVNGNFMRGTQADSDVASADFQYLEFNVFANGVDFIFLPLKQQHFKLVSERGSESTALRVPEA